MTDPSTARGDELSAPTPLSPNHDLSGFRSGNDSLDDWLRMRALRASEGTGRTYVVAKSAQVVGYYTLAAGAERRDLAPSKLRRNAPEQIPLILLARLAVDARSHGRGIGRGMLKDAISRVMQAAEIVGVRAMLVHAIDEPARAFYAKYGFVEFPHGSRTLFLPIETMQKAL